MESADKNAQALERYYQFHARIYDWTRWSYLFGRRAVVQLVKQHLQPQRILEVGCGTGYNLQRLSAAFPKAELTGIDLSQAMLDKAAGKLRNHQGNVRLQKQQYDAPIAPGHFDLVLFSYSLSMMNPGWDKVLQAATEDLLPTGLLAVTDFHQANFMPLRKWLQSNHVRLDGHLRPFLQELTRPMVDQQRAAFGGLWSYLVYLGRNDRSLSTSDRDSVAVSEASQQDHL